MFVVCDPIRCGNMAKPMVFLLAGGNAFTTFPRKRQTPRPLMTVWWDRGLLDEGQVAISIMTLGRLDIQTSSIITSLYDSVSQSLLRGPLVVRHNSSSGPRISIQINILCFAEH